MKRAEPAQFARANDLAHGANMRTKALGMAAEKLDLVLDRGLDHLLGFLQRYRHRLLDDNMLAGIGGDDCMGRVKPVGRRYPYGFDVGIGAHFLDAVVGLGSIALAKSFQHAGIDVGGGDQLKLRYLLHCR